MAPEDRTDGRTGGINCMAEREREGRRVQACRARRGAPFATKLILDRCKHISLKNIFINLIVSPV